VETDVQYYTEYSPILFTANMASTPKKQRQKPPKGRPSATTTISQPVVQESSASTFLSSFSSDGIFFAFVSLAVDKHRLRVYDTGSGQAVAEHVVDTGRITSLTWSRFHLSQWHQPAEQDGSDRPLKKQRKKRKSLVLGGSEADADSQAIEVVVLGVSNGTLLLFSPTRGRILRMLTHPTSTTPISSVMVAQLEGSTTIWTSSADGVIRLWNADKNDILASWKNDDRIPYSSMAIRPGSFSENGGGDVLLANHGIRLLSTSSDLSSENNFETQKPKELATFTGHASSIISLQWDASEIPSTTFLSMAQADRLLYVWEVPGNQAGSPPEGKIIGSVPLDSDARSMSLSIHTPKSTSTNSKQTLLTLSASGKVSIYPIPSELTPPASSNNAQHKVPSLLPRSNIAVSSKKSSSSVQVIDASFVKGEDGRIRVASLIGGVRPVFNLIVRLYHPCLLQSMFTLAFKGLPR
jgi:U3 small nucleolar RNA-associated protein 5